MAQIARPDSDISVGTWSPYPADPTTLFDKINEVTPNGDTDYIHSDLDEDVCEVGVGDATDPAVGTGHKIRCYAKSPSGGGAKEQMTIALVENGNVRGVSPAANVNRTSYGLIEYTLLEAEANAIQNYVNLRLRFHITKVNGGEPIQITQAEFECPDATEAHAGSSSISGNGSLTGIAKKGAKQSLLISAAGALIALGLVGMLGVAPISGGGTPAAIGQKAAQIDAAISGGGTIVATGTKAEGEPHSGSAAISGNGALPSQGKKGAEDTGVISGNGAVVVQGIKGAEDVGAISGGGEVPSSGEKAGGGIAEVTGNGSIIATGTKQEAEQYSGDALISGNGLLATSSLKGGEGATHISREGALAGVGEKQTSGDSVVTGGGSLVAVGTMSESHFGVAIISESGVIDGVGIKQAPGSLVIIGGGSIVAAGYGQEVLIEVVKTVFLNSKLTERLVELKSTIKRSIVLDSEINPDEGE